jgi:hypothetical protein
MTTIRFEEVSLRARKRWKDADGKRHQETKKFFQTMNPFNKAADGWPKTRYQIMEELMTEREFWLARSPQ